MTKNATMDPFSISFSVRYFCFFRSLLQRSFPMGPRPSGVKCHCLTKQASRGAVVSSDMSECKPQENASIFPKKCSVRDCNVLLQLFIYLLATCGSTKHTSVGRNNIFEFTCFVVTHMGGNLLGLSNNRFLSNFQSLSHFFST